MKANPRFCYIVLSTQADPDKRGYIPSVVFEGESGHSPMTGDPKRLQTPWVWGPTFKEAEEQCRMAVIVASSMRKMSLRG